MKITLLHLSDLHLMEESLHDQNVVLNALVLDIEAIRNVHQFDAIIFSGDLVGKGTFSDKVHAEVVDNLVPRLLKASEIPADRLFFVPGNHDMALSRSDPFLQPSIESLRTKTDINTFVDSASERAFLWRHLEPFSTLRSAICAAAPVANSPLYEAYIFEKNGFRIGIGCMNSAWKATGKPNDYDYGKLVISERQVERVAAALEGCNLKIAVLHHPLPWLATYDFAGVQTAIFRNFHALFHGHNHTSDALNVAHLTGSILFSNAGCLYQSRDYFNGYSIVEFDSDQRSWTINAREYFGVRKCFDQCLRFAPNGIQSFQLVSSPSEIVVQFPSEQYLQSLGKL